MFSKVELAEFAKPIVVCLTADELFFTPSRYRQTTVLTSFNHSIPLSIFHPVFLDGYIVHLDLLRHYPMKSIDQIEHFSKEYPMNGGAIKGTGLLSAYVGFFSIQVPFENLF